MKRIGGKQILYCQSCLVKFDMRQIYNFKQTKRSDPMGNHIEGEKYCFSEEYQVLNNSQPEGGFYHLKDKNNSRELIGRELKSTDQEDIFQMKCIIEEKTNNPSPFVTKILQHKQSHEQSYCSNTHHFYLLYSQPSQRLSQEIRERREAKIPFSPIQIDLVVTKISKGLKYLYGINHHHCKVTSEAITWPFDPKENIQLIDEWAIDQESQLKKMKFYRPKDQDQTEQKNQHLCSDLYYLGLVAQQMQKVADYQGFQRDPQIQQDVNNLHKKISTLTSYRPQDRMKIFQFMPTQDGRLYQRKIVGKMFDKNMKKQIMNGQREENERKNVSPLQNKETIGNYVHPSTPIQQIGISSAFQPASRQVSFSPQPIPFQPHFQINNSFQNKPFQSNQWKQPQGLSRQSSITRFDTRPISMQYSEGFKQKHVNFNTKNPQLNNASNTNFTFASPSLNKPSYSSSNYQNNSFDSAKFYNSLNMHNRTQSKFTYPTVTTNYTPNVSQKPIFQHKQQLKHHYDPISFSLNQVSFQKSSYLQKSQQKNNYNGSNFGMNSQNVNFSGSKHFSQNNYPQSKNAIIGSYDQKETKNTEIESKEQKKQVDQKLESLKLDNQKNKYNGSELYQFNPTQQPNIVVHKAEIFEQNSTPARRPGNNLFSTIPEVSERSQSAKSQEDRQYVIQEYENGSRYEGYKKNGMRNGRGKFYYQEGSFYDGEWKNNNMHGFGKLYYSNGKMAYEGQWFIDQFHGKGKVYNDIPVYIEGMFDFKNFDDLDEKWKYYEGTLVSDSKEGYGKLVLSNGEFYEGEFQNDKVQGKGKFVTITGETINGVWKNNRIVQMF